MSLMVVAQETLRIVELGTYVAPSGRAVELRAELDRALSGTALYRPRDLEALVAAEATSEQPNRAPLRIEVTGETTAEAGRRLVSAEGVERVVALNYASAKNPGGGFLGGAKAQEEDLARCSALYPCQLRARAYYEANRAHRSLLYTHHMIYSPDVPFFRDERLELLEAPFLLSIITAPAPNRGALGRKTRPQELEATLYTRAEMVLAVAAHHGHRTLVLGAWGCGVFRNDPRQVATVFRDLLAKPRWAHAFERVVFGVYDRSKGQTTLGAFREVFASHP